MPQKAEATTTTGAQEALEIMLLSEAAERFTEGELEDAIVIVIPDTGKAQFNPSHEIKTGKQAGKMSKATFVIGEIGSSFASEYSGYKQSQGDVEGLPVNIRLSVTATPPNREGKTVEEALNRKPELREVPRTGTDN